MKLRNKKTGVGRKIWHEITVVKNLDTGKKVILPREKLDPEQFNENCEFKFHQNCIAYEDVIIEDEEEE